MNDKRFQDETLSNKADAAFQRAAKKVILLAEQTSTPVLVWEKNRIQEIPEDRFKALLVDAKLK